MTNRRKMLAAMGSALVSPVLAPKASAQARWRFATAYEDSNFHTRNNIRFVTEFQRGTQGRDLIDLQTTARLFAMPQILGAVQSGQAQLGEILLPAYGAEDPVFELSGLPMLATSYARSRKLLEAAKPLLTARFARRGIALLQVVPWPTAGFFGPAALTGTEQLRGARIRTYSVPTDRLVTALGGVPVRLETVEIPAALEAGRIDWMITSPPTAVDTEAFRKLPHYTACGFTLVWNAVLCNQAALAALPAASQAALRTAAADAVTRGWDLSENSLTETLRILRQEGMRMHEPTPALLAGLTQRAEPMIQDWAGHAGPDGKRLLDAYRAA